MARPTRTGAYSSRALGRRRGRGGGGAALRGAAARPRPPAPAAQRHTLDAFSYVPAGPPHGPHSAGSKALETHYSCYWSVLLNLPPAV